MPGSGNRTGKESLSRKTLAPSFSLRETVTQFIAILCCPSGLNVGRGTLLLSEVAVLRSKEKSQRLNRRTCQAMSSIELTDGKRKLVGHNMLLQLREVQPPKPCH